MCLSDLHSDPSALEVDSTLVSAQGGSNAIYWASRHGHVDTLKFLHENKCPLDVKDKVRPLSLGTGGAEGGNKRLHLSFVLPRTLGPTEQGFGTQVFVQII